MRAEQVTEHGVTRSRTAILLSAVALIAIGLSVSLFDDPGQDSESEWEAISGRLLDRSFEGPLANPLPSTDNPRRTSTYIGILIAGLLSILYAYRRRRYIAEWIGAWLLVALVGYIISRGYANADEAGLAMGVLEILKVGAALLLLRSAHSFGGTTAYSNKDWVLIPGLLVWLAVSDDRLSVPMVLAPAYILTGLIHTRAATLFASVFRQRRLLGALMLALSLGAIGVANLAFGPFFERTLTSDQALLVFLTVNSLSFLLAAFGMHLAVFEEIVHELRGANRELREAQGELERMATVDALTGCNNRHSLEQNLDRELERHRRYDTPLSLLFVDIDRFKNINDSFGHAVGDQVLKYVGDFLRHQIREADYVVRWGGDEFLVLMTCSGEEAAAKARELRQSLAGAVDSNLLPPGLSLSIGHAEIPSDATEILSFIQLADQNMYMNKIGGETI